MSGDMGALSGSREPSLASLSRPVGFDPERDPIWPHVRITSYAPSHRQFRLEESLTPEQITEALKGIEPRETPDGDKVTLQWQFWAEVTYNLPEGGHGATSTCCKIWDYCGERWSAYGWPEAFEQLGLVPLFSKDYGSWSYEEDGNPTLQFLRKGLQAIATEAGTAETVKQGSVHEGAGLKGIAQVQHD